MPWPICRQFELQFPRAAAKMWAEKPFGSWRIAAEREGAVMNAGTPCRASLWAIVPAALAKVLAIAVFALSGAAQGQQTADDYEAGRLVSEALQRGARGDVAGRQEFLGEAIRRFPDFAPARWHSGQILQDGEWRDLEAVRRAAADRPTLLEYYRRRDKAPTTVAGQLQLARWCQRNLLNAERRAHLTSVLTIDPGHAVARRDLGFVRVAGEWILQEDLARRENELAARRTAFEHWRPIVAEIRTGLRSADESKRTQALQRLQEVRGAETVDALEWAFATEELATAGPALEALAQTAGPEATALLGRFAAFSHSNDVRLAAVSHLAARPIDESVSPLLELLSTQIENRINYVASPTGQLYVRHLFYRESANSRHYFVSDFDYAPASKMQRAASSESGGNFMARLNHYLGHVKMDRDLGSEQRSLEQQNESIAEVNARVIWVLKRLLKTNLGDDPYAWWEYWYGYPDAGGDDKKIVAKFQRKRESVSFPRCEAVHGVSIQTERGAIPIEEVRVGDRALAQDSETGELALQPVLFVSHTADAREVVTMRLAGNAVEATPSQRFWVVGRGWIAASELKPGDRIHGLHGASRVESVEAGKRAKTTHIVIGGSQNAFLGQEALLGGDHSSRPPSQQPIPGMGSLP